MAKMTLDDLVSQLRATYAETLRAIVLYGSAAGGDHHAKHSDQNILVIVSALSLDVMSAAGAVARAWGEAGNPPPLTLTDAEWRSSVDVFAMEHAEIRDRHKLLFTATGFDPLAGVLVSRADIRRQLEYEGMATLLAVRSGILVSKGDFKDRAELLAGSARRVLALFRGLLRLLGVAPDRDNEAVCRAAAAKAGFDPEPFVAVVAHRRGTTKLGRDGVAAVLWGYHDGLERLVAFLDALPVAD